MNALTVGLALFLLLNLAVGMLRVYWGPTAGDRIMAAQLFGTTTVAILLLLAEAMDIGALRDVALLFVLLATLITVAFVNLPSQPEERE
jgi:multicomponent Na+:H+ antiporter subunit F